MEDGQYVRYQDGELSALYVDGVLNISGEHHLVDERISELLGVERVKSNAFLLGQNSSSKVARTLDELDNWEDRQEAATAHVGRIREQARAIFGKAPSQEPRL